jgi:pSer/pThr/pTyr-binding forkhead associated (FHA) protein/tetratricopeptide (TPR) repeat protein
MTTHLLVPPGASEDEALPLESFPYRIGSGRRNDLILTHPDVAEEHCVIFNRMGKLTIEDRSEGLGTFVNGSRVRRHDLVDGDQLRIGSYGFRYRCREEAGRAAVDAPTDAEGATAAERAEEARAAAAARATPEFDDEEEAVTDRGMARAKLLIFEGQDLIKEVPLAHQVTVIGRSKTCDVCLTSSEISRHHFRIVMHRNQFFAEDLGSSNGTYLNQELMTTRRLLHDGDELTIGPYDLILQLLGEKGAARARKRRASREEPKEAAGAAPGPAAEGAVDPQELPRLLVVGRRDRGRVIVLDRETMMLGRDPENDVVIEDDSVSRHHAMLTVAGGTVTIEDRNSLNGVEINGELVTRAELQPGDAIVLGQVELRYVAPGAELPPLPEEGEEAAEEMERLAPPEAETGAVEAPVAAPGAWRILPYVLIGALSLAVIGLFIALYLRFRGPAPPAPPAPSPTAEAVLPTAPPPPTATPELPELDRLRELVEGFEWKAALEEGARLAEKGRESPALKSLLERAAWEQANKERLDAAIALEESGRFASALAQLQAIPEESVYAANARFKAEEIRKRLARDQLAIARDLLEIGNEDDAERALGEAERLAGGDPEITREIARIRAGLARSPAPSQVPRAARRESEVQRILARGDEVWEQGDPREALRRYREVETSGLPETHTLVEQARSRRLWLEEAFDLLDKGRKAFDEGDYDTARSEWQKLLDKERRFRTVRTRSFRNMVERDLVASLLRVAEREYARQEYCTAYTCWRQALELQPNNRSARMGLDRYERRISDIYREAFFMEDTNPEQARRRYEMVFEMTCPEHPYHAKAEKSLRSLARRGQ